MRGSVDLLWLAARPTPPSRKAVQASPGQCRGSPKETGGACLVPRWFEEKPARFTWAPGLEPSAPGLAVEVDVLVTVFTGALGVSEPSSSLPGDPSHVNVNCSLAFRERKERGGSLMRSSITEELEEVLRRETEQVSNGRSSKGAWQGQTRSRGRRHDWANLG